MFRPGSAILVSDSAGQAAERTSNGNSSAIPCGESCVGTAGANPYLGRRDFDSSQFAQRGNADEFASSQFAGRVLHHEVGTAGNRRPISGSLAQHNDFL